MKYFTGLMITNCGTAILFQVFIRSGTCQMLGHVLPYFYGPIGAFSHPVPGITLLSFLQCQNECILESIERTA